MSHAEKVRYIAEYATDLSWFTSVVTIAIYNNIDVAKRRKRVFIFP